MAKCNIQDKGKIYDKTSWPASPFCFSLTATLSTFFVSNTFNKVPLLNDLGWMKKKQYKMLKFQISPNILGWSAKVQYMCWKLWKLYLNEVL